MLILIALHDLPGIILDRAGQRYRFEHFHRPADVEEPPSGLIEVVKTHRDPLPARIICWGYLVHNRAGQPIEDLEGIPIHQQLYLAAESPPRLNGVPLVPESCQVKIRGTGESLPGDFNLPDIPQPEDLEVSLDLADQIPGLPAVKPGCMAQPDAQPGSRTGTAP